MSGNAHGAGLGSIERRLRRHDARRIGVAAHDAAVKHQVGRAGVRCLLIAVLRGRMTRETQAVRRVAPSMETHGMLQATGGQAQGVQRRQGEFVTGRQLQLRPEGRAELQQGMVNHGRMGVAACCPGCWARPCPLLRYKLCSSKLHIYFIVEGRR